MATTLTPQMRQGLAYLAMSLPELRSELLSEMSRNPVIADVEPTLEKTTVSDKECEAVGSDVVNDYPDDDNASDAARLEGFNRPDDYEIGGAYDRRTVPDAEAIERRQKFLENQIAVETLEHHLLAQLPSSDIATDDYPIAESLIGELDDDGRFVGSIPDIMMVSGASEAKIREILAKIRDFDPPGCGATTLAECLAAQLDKIPDDATRRRVASLLDRLEDVAAGKAGDPKALQALRSLDPRPGRAYGRNVRGPEYVNPEVHAVRCQDGWAATVDGRSLPEIRISPKYLAMMENPSVSAEVKKYIRERTAAAKTIVEAMEKRQDTVTNIAQEIFDRQPGFFQRGLVGLVPMTMQEVADAVGVHVTTVSRTVNGKYASTPKGVVELRRFFSHGIATESGEVVSREGVLERLRTLVEAEDRSNPLSDGKIVDLLKNEGFSVARRTVAKYRGMLGIPVADERRHQKSGGLNG